MITIKTAIVNYIMQSIIITIINEESVISFSLILLMLMLMFKIYSAGTATNTHILLLCASFPASRSQPDTPRYLNFNDWVNL